MCACVRMGLSLFCLASSDKGRLYLRTVILKLHGMTKPRMYFWLLRPRPIEHGPWFKPTPPCWAAILAREEAGSRAHNNNAAAETQGVGGAHKRDSVFVYISQCRTG